MAEEPSARGQGEDSEALPTDESQESADEVAQKAADVAPSTGGVTVRRLKAWLPWAIAGAACVVAVAALIYAAQSRGASDYNAGPATLTGWQGLTPGSSIASRGAMATAQKPGVGTSKPKGGTSAGTSRSGSSGTQGPSIAAPGSRLTTITTPPEHTVGLLKIPDSVKSAAFSVKFKPYGWGPGGQARGNLVVAVVSSSPAGGDAAKLLDLTGKNASFWAAPTLAARIKLGGSYTGRIAVRIEGDTGRLMLTSAAPAE